MPEQLELWESLPVDDLPSPLPVISGETPSVSSPPSPDPRQAEKITQCIRKKTGLDTLAVVFTDNRHTLMRVYNDKADNHRILRLHWMFLEAPEPILQAVAHWVKHPRSNRNSALFRAFFAENEGKIAGNDHLPVPSDTCRPQGHVYHLKELYDAINQQEFDGKVTAYITWGRWGAVRKGHGRSIRFGSYAAAQHLIRIHPVLDDTFVPLFFIRYIVFHEMLHAYMGVTVQENGRRSMHSPAFKKREQAYAGFWEAEEWLKSGDHLRRLLRRR